MANVDNLLKNEIAKASTIYIKGFCFKRKYTPKKALEKIEKFLRDKEKKTLIVRPIVGPDYIVVEEPKYELGIRDNGSRMIEVKKKIVIREKPLIDTSNNIRVREILSKKITLILN